MNYIIIKCYTFMKLIVSGDAVGYLTSNGSEWAGKGIVTPLNREFVLKM